MNRLQTWFAFWIAIRMSRFLVWLGDKQAEIGRHEVAQVDYKYAHKFQEHARRISPARFARYVGANSVPEG